MTAIEWTDQTWNPTTGCDRVSPGCDHCYALTMAARLKAMGQPKYQRDGDPRTSGPGFGLTCHDDVLDEPRRWRKPRLVFVNSMSDWLHPEVPDPFVKQMWDVMVATPRHTYQLLTKRAKRLARVLGPRGIGFYKVDGPVPCPQPNIWLGVSIESDRYTWRTNPLAITPAAVRFVSLEPLLTRLPSLDLRGVDWCIVGGESGPGARPLDVDWIREIRDHCDRTGTALFVKQLGSVWSATRLGHSGKAGKSAEWPSDIRVREMPRG